MIDRDIESQYTVGGRQITGGEGETMTLQMLQYFLEIAKTGSFTRAAEQSFVTQPALSRAIRDLEEELGCKLLHRTKRTVELTEAGRVCAEEAQRVLNDVQRLCSRVRESAYFRKMPLKTGYIIYEHLMCLITPLTNPDDGKLPILLEPKYFSCREARKRFEANELDLLVLPEPCISDMSEVECVRLTRGRAYAIVPRGCALYERERVRLEELRGYPVIAWSREDVPLLDAAFESMFVQAGFKPEVVDQAEKMGDMQTKIMLHKAIGFGTSAASGRNSENVRYVEIEDSPEVFGIMCLWHKSAAPQQMEPIKAMLLSAFGQAM